MSFQNSRSYLKNNYFEVNGKVKKQVSGTAIGTKFPSPYACIFMDQVEIEFLKTQKHKPLVWFCYTDDVFIIWTNEKEKLSLFSEDLIKFQSTIKFSHDTNIESIHFLDLNVRLQMVSFRQICMLNLQTTNIFTTHRLIQIT